MIYKVKDKSLKAALAIQFRFFQLAIYGLIILLSIATLFSILLDKTITLTEVHYYMGAGLIVLMLYRFSSFAWGYHKNSDSDFVELSATHIITNYKDESNKISLPQIEKAVLYRMLGNDLLILVDERGKYEIMINSYEGNLYRDICTQLGSDKTHVAGIFDTIKFLIYG